MAIGTSGIILSGAGTYVFRSIGALTTVVNSTVTLSNGASTCDVFWTPVATTLGANSTFLGTVIDNAGITLGDSVAWIGRALNFATTITTDNDTITVPTCSAQATLHVVKQVINDNGGTAISSLFALYVKRFGVNVVGSPGSGTASPGISYSLNAGTYVVSENTNTSYTQSFGGDCNASGSITLAPGDNKTCTITNNDIAAPSGGGGGGGGLSKDYCPNGDTSPSYYDGICGAPKIVVTISSGEVANNLLTGNNLVSSNTTSGTIVTPSTNVSSGTATPVTNELSPKFPKTGLEEENTTSWNILAVISAFVFITSSSIIVFNKRKI